MRRNDTTAEEPAIPVVYGAPDDFDFFEGTWNIRMRRLRTILRGNDEWYDVNATATMRKIAGGLGNVDHFCMTTPNRKVFAMTVRLFDTTHRQWSIYWASTTKEFALEPPVVGGFEHGDGLFYGADTYNGVPILVRFFWRRGQTPHWKQAFSPDGGRTWETNWTMQFERAAVVRHRRVMSIRGCSFSSARSDVTS